MHRCGLTIGILCALLIFEKSDAAPTTDVSVGTLPIDATATETTIANDNYDVVDVANQKTGNAHSLGQTTRIVTTGELDDAFWMKHLGDDFKYAIHLQVAGNNLVPYKGYSSSSSSSSNSKSSNETKSEQNATTPLSSEQTAKPLTPNDAAETKNNTENPLKSSNSTNSISQPKLSETKNDSKPPHKRTATKSGNHKQSKKNIRNFKHVKSSKDAVQKATANRKPNDEATHSPVVVTLPEMRSEALQISEHEVPMVVKMPPVIYHQKTNTDADAADRRDQNSKADERTPQKQDTNTNTQHTQHMIDAYTQGNAYNTAYQYNKPTVQHTDTQQQQQTIDAFQQADAQTHSPTQYTSLATNTHTLLSLQHDAQQQQQQRQQHQYLQQQSREPQQQQRDTQPQQPTTHYTQQQQQHNQQQQQTVSQYTPYTTQNYYTNPNTNSNSNSNTNTNTNNNHNNNNNAQSIDISSYTNSPTQSYPNANAANQLLKTNNDMPNQSDIRYIIRKTNSNAGYSNYSSGSGYLPMDSQYEGYRRVSRSAKQLFCQGL